MSKSGKKMGFLRNAKMATKILCIVIPIVFLVGTIISIAMIVEFNTQTSKLAQEKVDMALSQLVDDIDYDIENSVHAAELIASDAAAAKAMATADKATVKKIVDRDANGVGADFITMIDKTGTVYATSDASETDTGIKYTDTTAVKTVAQTGNATTTVEQIPTSELAVVGCVPVKHEGNVVGYAISGYNLGSMNEVDHLKSVYKTIDFTIFKGDTRISTTLEKDGVRQVGTAANKEISDLILGGKQESYDMQTALFGTQYLVEYRPLKDTSGSIVGMLFAGTPISELEAAETGCIILGYAMVFIFVLISIFAVRIISRKTVTKYIDELVEISEQLSVGEIDMEIADTECSKDEIGKLRESFLKIIETNKENAQNIRKMARGNFDFEVNKKSEDDVMSIAVQRIKDTLGEIVSDIDGLAQAAINGNLKAQIDPDKHSGQYQKIVEGINGTLSTIVSTLQVGLDNLTEISKGNTVDLIDNTYKGDYYDFIENINTLNTTIKALQDTVTDLIAQAQGGSLSYRADAGALQGNYAEIISGINELLDTVILPVNEAAEVLEKLAQGNLDYKVEGDYVGDHAKIKNAVNDTIDNLAIYINDIKRVLIECSNGNLDVQTTAQFKGEFVQLGEAIEKTVASFNETLIEINNASDQVAAGARQVSDAGQSLSQGATEQAGSVEELSATIAEIAQETQNNALLARQSDELGNATRNGAIASNEKMNEMLQAMNDINESSNNISKIIKVIDDIAFQTNILALNAAVEAARAGQYGKGFAVVAEEVRTLAAKSATAANETTALIETSITKVEEGTQKAEETAENLKAIIADIEKSTDLINKISNSSDEQAAAVAQINKGIEQVAQVTQTNSATAEESAAASEELSSQAEFLKQMVGKFNFKNEKTDDFFAPKKASRKADVADFDDDSFGKY